MADATDGTRNVVDVEPNIYSMAQSLGRIEGQLKEIPKAVLINTDRIVEIEKRLDGKVDKGTFWKVFGAAQTIITGILSWIVTGRPGMGG